MQIKVKRECYVNVRFIAIDVPVDDDDELPEDLPFRSGDRWYPVIDVDAGRITAWTGLAISVNLKPRDSGTYRLIDDHGETIATIDEDYVPNAAIPGSYGDYIELEIEADGKITNWKRPSFKEFFRKTD